MKRQRTESGPSLDLLVTDPKRWHEESGASLRRKNGDEWMERHARWLEAEWRYVLEVFGDPEKYAEQMREDVDAECEGSEARKLPGVTAAVARRKRVR